MKGKIIKKFILIILVSYSVGNEYYFYTGKNYGSEAMFNPVNVLLNNGYDIIQFSDHKRYIFDFPYLKASGNIINTVTHPWLTIKNYGVKQFLFNEIFPLSIDVTGRQWWPNYTIHLIGNGMTYRKLTEWYKYYNYQHYILLGLSTTTAFHFLNEVLENESYERYNADALADLLFFDIGGILLFRSDKISEFFAKKLNLADWSLQPSFDLYNKSLHNVGQYYSIKVAFPNSDHLYLFYSFGLDGLIGTSYKYSNGDAISFGVGLIGRKNIIINDDKNIKSVKLEWSCGLFYDRNNSLLFSIRYIEKYQYQLVTNIYPGLIKIGKFSPGVWGAVGRDGNYIVGITTTWIPGIVLNSLLF